MKMPTDDDMTCGYLKIKGMHKAMTTLGRLSSSHGVGVDVEDVFKELKDELYNHYISMLLQKDPEFEHRFGNEFQYDDLRGTYTIPRISKVPRTVGMPRRYVKNYLADGESY